MFIQLNNYLFYRPIEKDGLAMFLTDNTGEKDKVRSIKTSPL